MRRIYRFSICLKQFNTSCNKCISLEISFLYFVVSLVKGMLNRQAFCCPCRHWYLAIRYLDFSELHCIYLKTFICSSQSMPDFWEKTPLLTSTHIMWMHFVVWSCAWIVSNVTKACVKMIGAVSICHYGFQNARRSKFPTCNETAGVQVLCTCAIPLPSSVSVCDVTKR